MIKKYLFFLLLFTSFAFSQEDAWVYFKTKSNSAAFLASPLLMLSQRALDRRTIQKINLDSKDIPIDLSFINQVKAVSGITVMAKSKWLNALHIRGIQADINSLKNLSFVEKVVFADRTLNLTAKKGQVFKTKNKSKILETKIDYAYGTSANQIQMLNGHLLHQKNFTGSGKIIAVLDAGFPGVDAAQPFQRLRDNNQILGGYDYVTRNSNFYSGGTHGTLVLSTMGGYKENELIGTAPDAKYYLFITEDDVFENPVEESLWVEAAEKADSLGVDIINTSLGYFGDHDNPAYDHLYSDMTGDATFISKGANVAFSRGMVVVASAGNEGSTSEPHIGSPADAFSVLSVGSVNSVKTASGFSSIGPSFDGRVKPDIMAQGQTVYLSDPLGNIVTANGTSFSGPITAGMVACLWQAFPTKTNLEIKQMILQSADRFTLPTTKYGYGIPDYNLALMNNLSVTDFYKNNFVLYPNPTNNFISASLPDNFEKGTIVIYSVLGKKIMQRDLTKQSPTISLELLNKGIYFYKFETNGFSRSGKIIKQ